MKQAFLSILFAILPIVASADVVEIDGIYYDLVVKSKIAEVTSKPNGKYNWEVNIPASFVYGGETYSVTSIGYGAFRDCNELNKVTIPNSVTNIGMFAFYGCSRLKSIDIPNSVTYIDKEAFAYCSGLTSINIPNSVTSVGWYVFYNCTSLTSVVIPNSMKTINNNMFSGCTNLKDVTIPGSVTDIRYGAFSGCKNLSSITFPNQLGGIGDYAFTGTSLKTVDIPNSTKQIGIRAFAGCQLLTSVHIGSGIKNILDNAFGDCPEIQEVYCLAKEVPDSWDMWGNKVYSAFDGSHAEDIMLYVPVSSVNKYKAVEPWKSFKAIIGIEEGVKKCATPTISYQNGKLMFSCETEGVDYETEITDADIRKHYGASISLTATYNISVFATKMGYDNSDVATATLCWIDVEPRTEGIANDVAEVRALPVLIKHTNGRLIIEGADAGTHCYVYTTDGKLVKADITTSAPLTLELPVGRIYILKVGTKTLKVAL